MLFNTFDAGQLSIGGYPRSLIDMIIEKDYLDKDKYHLFASQFAIHSDKSGSWRGEFWGKFVRGACECYKASNNAKLYKIIEDSVMEMLSYVEPDGTLSSYIKEERFTGWDMWSRKYAMIGFLSYLSISKYEGKKRKVLSRLKKQASKIMKAIGKGRGKKDILDTSNIYGSLNSASILGVYVALYNLTGIKKYLDFATYIVSSGLSKGEDLVSNALKEGSYPYMWKSKKAYEMIACFQGLLYYGVAKKEQRYIDAVASFVHKVAESDFTIVGGIGTESEFFNNSSLKQVNPSSKPGLETCVTVQFMSLCFDMLRFSGNGYYASLLETMSYNALFGATNDENQKMDLAEGRVWRLDGYDTPPHESYCFDSYSPLVHQRRARLVGGYMRLQNNKSYGCCAANGGYGLGLVSAFSFLKKDGGYVLNLYNSFHAKDFVKGKKISFSLIANLYKKGSTKLRIDGNNERFELLLRVPNWSTIKLKINGEPLKMETAQDGYIHIDRIWGKDVMSISLSLSLSRLELEGKVAYKRGPIVLAFDKRFGNLYPLPSQGEKWKLVDNSFFQNNETIEFANGLKLCDYASAAKNMDDKDAFLAVWMDEKSSKE